MKYSYHALLKRHLRIAGPDGLSRPLCRVRGRTTIYEDDKHPADCRACLTKMEKHADTTARKAMMVSEDALLDIWQDDRRTK